MSSCLCCELRILCYVCARLVKRDMVTAPICRRDNTISSPRHFQHRVFRVAVERTSIIVSNLRRLIDLLVELMSKHGSRSCRFCSLHGHLPVSVSTLSEIICGDRWHADGDVVKHTPTPTRFFCLCDLVPISSRHTSSKSICFHQLGFANERMKPRGWIFLSPNFVLS